MSLLAILRFEDPDSPFSGVSVGLPRRSQIIEDLRARAPRNHLNLSGVDPGRSVMSWYSWGWLAANARYALTSAALPGKHGWLIAACAVGDAGEAGCVTALTWRRRDLVLIPGGCDVDRLV